MTTTYRNDHGTTNGRQSGVNRFSVLGSIAVIFCSTPNGKTYSVLIDRSDLERVLAAGVWRVANFANKRERGIRLYAYTMTGNPRRMVYLHRFVALPESGFLVDHINHRGTDNRRGNLRSVSGRINQLHRKNASEGRSGLRGVIWNKRSEKWVARVNHKHLGTFTDVQLASAAVHEYLQQIGV